tara:strand:- start:630 stop:1679 length:1050 start_codon:yes stop_codon:yes gene_type:complete
MKRLLLLITICISSVSFGQYTSIPDPNFEQALIDLGHDDVIDGQVLTSNISGVTNLNVSNKNIYELTGINSFTSLINLNCANNSITVLNLYDSPILDNLENIHCPFNGMDSLVFGFSSGGPLFIPDLKVLNCSHNNINEIDVQSFIYLESLSVTQNSIQNLKLNNPNLIYLEAGDNNLDSLNLFHCYALSECSIFDGTLKTLITNDCGTLEQLVLDNNELLELDVSSNTYLADLQVNDNNLYCLNIKNGNISMSCNAENNPNLYCIEVNDVAYSTNQSVSGFFGIDPQVIFSEDCGDCSSTSSLTELTTSKNFIQILDMMGRETSFKPNTPLIYVYDDGSIEKVFTIED